jgi:serine/threonine protein kinase
MGWVCDAHLAARFQVVDVWGVGIIMYICLSGYPPFTEDDENHGLKEQIMGGMLRFPAMIAGQPDVWLVSVCNVITFNPLLLFYHRPCLGRGSSTRFAPPPTEAASSLTAK